MASPIDSHVAVLNSLKGQTLLLPDLAALVYPDWAVHRYANDLELRTEIESEFLERYIASAKTRQQLKKSNAAMLSGYFWSGTQIYGQDSKVFLQWCLDPSNYHPARAPCPTIQAKHNCDCFQEIGEAMQTGHSRDALYRFMGSLKEYVDSVCSAQEIRTHTVPDLDEYFRNRIYSIGAFPCIMAMEVNDILSLKKGVRRVQMPQQTFAKQYQVLIQGCKNMMLGNIKWS
ncbi:hypothetical protein BO71DRAFT_452189 [Aspergillus ellipticus CBS 707.79]|uniref:Terpenoid synthase n=1 Tax=Aspergillus ellipticus CBS 707.79 TaxID=1448320 RepID=A0A319DAB4_9EURO|nr:hypothetical protein BO71DRAFT_452189 [Aspergillus ellipticus CBS 707.79]